MNKAILLARPWSFIEAETRASLEKKGLRFSGLLGVVLARYRDLRQAARVDPVMLRKAFSA